jgi:AcrR family transcriptional regulator
MANLTTPKQERSAQTLAALLSAAAALLERATPEELSVAAVCRGAGVTTGAFYARFQDRLALFDVLEERLYARFDEVLEAIEDSPAAGLEDTIRLLIEGTAELYGRHGGTIRAIRILALGDRERAGRVAAHNRRVLEWGVERLLEHRGEIRRPDPEAAARRMLVWAVAILRQRILFEDLSVGATCGEETAGVVELAALYLKTDRD